MTTNPNNSREIQLSTGLGLTLTEAGTGRPVLILHGGAGPFSVASIAQHVAAKARAITPTHPGWNGTPRPEWLTGVDDLALAYLELLEREELRDVLVIGSSIGGWIASEMAVRDRGARIGGLILINSAGVAVEGQPITDFFSLTPRQVAEHSFHEPDKFFRDPAQLPPEQAAMQRANIATLRVLSTDPYMHDPKLLRRLKSVRIPMLAIWGESDRIFTPAYGKAYAGAFGNGRFALVERAGHLPQLERPSETFALIDQFPMGRAGWVP